MSDEPEEDPKPIATGMTLADISIRNHVFAWMLMVAPDRLRPASASPASAAWSRASGSARTPTSTSRSSTSRVTYEGASPEIMETDVVDFIEDAVTSIEGVKQISSTSRQGSANITVEFELSRNIDAALQDVQTRVAQAARRLPREIDPPIITKNNPEDQPIMWLSLSGNRPPDLHGRLRAQRAAARSSRPSRAWARSSSAATASATSASGSTPPRLEAQGLTVQDVIARHPARAPRGAGRPHRDARARDERARRGRGHRPRGLPRPRGRLPRGRARSGSRTWRWWRTGSRTAAAWPAPTGEPVAGLRHHASCAAPTRSRSAHARQGQAGASCSPACPRA